MVQVSFIQNVRHEGGRKCPYSTSEANLDGPLLRNKGNPNLISRNALYLKD